MAISAALARLLSGIPRAPLNGNRDVVSGDVPSPEANVWTGSAYGRKSLWL